MELGLFAQPIDSYVNMSKNLMRRAITVARMRVEPGHVMAYMFG